jgi:hypothetical protein
MKTTKQIEKEINKQLDRFDKPSKKLNILEALADQAVVLAYIIGFVLSQKERMAVPQKTRERLLKATKDFRNAKS